MLKKMLPYANYWHMKNYIRDYDPAIGFHIIIMTTVNSEDGD